MKDDQSKGLDYGRRTFLCSSLATGVGAATAVALPGVAVGDESPSRAKEQKGYRLTPHILEYYKTTAS